MLVFAAATLKPALGAIVAVYRKASAGEVVLAYGPSPALAKQIENGAPADLFISADPVWMDYLADRRLIRRHTRADLVRNTLVLAGPASGAAPKSAIIDRGFAIVQAVGSGPLCMCNPADHPAGRYGRAALESLGLWDLVASRVAIVANPQVAVAMVARNDAPAAVVFATDLKGVAGVRAAGTFPRRAIRPSSIRSRLPWRRRTPSRLTDCCNISGRPKSADSSTSRATCEGALTGTKPSALFPAHLACPRGGIGRRA